MSNSEQEKILGRIVA